MKSLLSDRLILRPMILEDAKDLCELNSDPDVLKFTGDSPFESIEEAQQFIQDYIAKQKQGFGRLTITRKSDDRYLGWCGLKDHGTFVDLGFRLKKEFWNKRYASESASVVLEHGFRNLELEEITGRTASENLASVAILKKLGMTFRRAEECHGIPNAQIYSIKKWEYQDLLNG